MHFPRLASSVVLALAATACSDSNSDTPDTSTNPNQTAGSTGGSASTGAGGSGGGASSAAGSGGSSSETPGTPALNQGGGTANGPGGGNAAGAAGSGTTPPAGDAGASASGMSFFLSSTGGPNGGNFGGIDGADAFCTMLATAADATLGAKTWRAYLSTSTVNAKDRIGAGPWRNAAGVVIGNNVDQLHAQTPGMNMNMPTGAASEMTYPINSNATALDERGNPLPNNPVLHDVLTGSNIDGTVSTTGTCSDWTSTAGMTFVGHSNRTGGGNNSSSWNSAHATPCAALNPPGTNQGGTVGQGGGRGSIYCFASD
jgi:hypothetical protein